MSTHKNFDIICVVVIVLSLVLTVLFMNGESLGIEAVVDEDAETYAGTAYFTANDLDGAWDPSSATVITLGGTEAKVSGAGAYAYGGSVYITGGGWYVLSGTLTDGSVVVDAYSSSKVWLLLDGVDIACSDGACLRVEQAEKVFLTLAGGTVNTLSSGAEYSDDAVSDGVGGAIFARDDLTINGAGSLAVTAAYKHGVEANDDLVITGGTITIDAARDAISANDSVRIMNASLTLTAEDDGIAVTGEDGYFYIESGALDITCGGDGVHTTGDVTVTGGGIAIDAGDDGVHSDTGVYISDGALLISDCYEGLEAPFIEVHGGDVAIYPTDDGFNASDGSGESFGMMGGPSGEASGETEDGETDEEESAIPYILITGGTVTVVNESGRDADGLDSNGSIYITGGDVRISTSSSSGSYALDIGSENGGVMEISGGTIIACGSYAMAESFDSSSAQCSILYTFSAGAEAGTDAAIEDADGNVLLAWTVPCDFTSMVISCPEMALDGSYLVVIGDNVEEITLDEVSASYGDAQSTMFGGNMNWGGMQPRGSFGGMRGRGASGEASAAAADESAVTADEAGQTAPGTPQPDATASAEMEGRGGRGDRQFGSGELDETQTEDEAETSTVGAATWVLIAASAVILLAGLIVAVKFRH